MPTTKQHWGKENTEVDKIQTTCIRKERATSRLRGIRGSCRSTSIECWLKVLKVNLKKIFDNNELLGEVVLMLQKTGLIDSESIIQRVESGLIQGEDNE